MSRQPTTSRRGAARPVTDRWSFKPVALLLLLCTVFAMAGATAVLIAPPFLGAAAGVKELNQRLEDAGADFTRIPKFPQRTTIYANDGTTILARVYLDNREIVPLREVSPIARKAVLAIEDSNFYDHGALDYSATFRALVENLRAGEVVQGGSTITQQLVKNTLGLDPNDQSFERKFQELALAIKVEQRYSKDRIFGMYLNQVYLGNNVYGIGTASEFYFAKPASELTLTEGAMLAGMIQSPATKDPLKRPRQALLARNDVLNRMMALGPSWLPETRGNNAKARDLGLSEAVGEFRLPTPPFLATYVKDQIIEDPNGWYAVLGETPEERATTLAEGGLEIVTTLDQAWLKAADRAANQEWSRWPEPPPGGEPADVAIVSLETRTGAIKTMLSGRNYLKDEKDTVTTVHQPGSSFKPYILAAAFENGIPPTATYSGAQGVIDADQCRGSDGSAWEVINAEGASRGIMNLYDATADSVNGVFARLILDAGLENTVDMARRMGVLSPLPAYCSLATGSVGISPLDQASGYQTIANNGFHCKPYAVTEIRSGDQILYRHRPECDKVLERPIANLITDMMVGVVEHGTAGGIFTESSGWTWPVAGKTGTADLNKAIWFGGFTRQVVTAVWVGSQGTPYPLEDRFGGDLFGSSLPAPIWKAYMQEIMSGMPALRFPEPQLVDVPNVVGMDEEEARKLLKEAGLRVKAAEIDDYRPEGTVIEQDPGGGSITIPGATITIGVSSGIAPELPVPKVYYLMLEQARSILASHDLFVEVVEEVTRDEELWGTVLRQAPKAGTIVDEGTTVVLTVAVEPEGVGEGDGNGNGNGNGSGGGTGGGGGNGGGGGGLRSLLR